MHEPLQETIRSLYGNGFIPLHRPLFEGDEKQYLVECIDSNFVSSVGERVTEFEERIARFVGARHAVATVNGTAALHAALVVAGVRPGDEVLTQALTFVATCNAVAYTGAHPVFVDVDTDTLGLSPEAVRRFLAEETERGADGTRVNRTTGRRVAACLPMHTFGHPCRIDELVAVCDEYGIPVVEDAAESLGSCSGERHTGTFGRLGTLSFNGNKVITTGGGGMIVTDDDELAARARHLTTTAKAPHGYEFYHDELGYNYRMPNLNAALGCAQMDRLPDILAAKREVARRYEAFFADQLATFIKERAGTTANYWLNAILVGSRDERDALLKATNDAGVMTRPIWQLMIHLPMYQHCQHDGLANSRWLEDRIVNLPSSVPAGWLA
ncbi:LegC family aminotransferase [Halorhodospira halophila]|uniref:LegC family aminotransferase n=1 Tax=Halorhodospira TaxID=85108 RepID=UPI001EE96986|nr:LegC family aminotransferase [Halorhodospira halophila]MCG5544586.1 LegC family aminotransferase [Halorhodospira sp. 9628]